MNRCVEDVVETKVGNCNRLAFSFPPRRYCPSLTKNDPVLGKYIEGRNNTLQEGEISYSGISRVGMSQWDISWEDLDLLSYNDFEIYSFTDLANYDLIEIKIILKLLLGR